MTQRTKEQFVDEILDLLLAVPENLRQNVIEDVQHNPFFCWDCGMGTRERPNQKCQCWNDE